jgi:hypothetical protein
MEPATLYLIYVATMGGPEKKHFEHFDSRAECEAKIARWHDDARKSTRFKVVRAACLKPTDYAPDWRSTCVIIDDSLDPKYRP